MMLNGLWTSGIPKSFAAAVFWSNDKKKKKKTLIKHSWADGRARRLRPEQTEDQCAGFGTVRAVTEKLQTHTYQDKVLQKPDADKMSILLCFSKIKSLTLLSVLLPNGHQHHSQLEKHQFDFYSVKSIR